MGGSASNKKPKAGGTGWAGHLGVRVKGDLLWKIPVFDGRELMRVTGPLGAVSRDGSTWEAMGAEDKKNAILNGSVSNFHIIHLIQG